MAQPSAKVRADKDKDDQNLVIILNGERRYSPPSAARSLFGENISKLAGALAGGGILEDLRFAVQWKSSHIS